MKGKVKVMATAIHPSRAEGMVYEIIEIQAISLASRGFVLYPIPEIIPEEPKDKILPKAIKITKSKSIKNLSNK